MYTQVVRPESLSYEDLDAYLARGWYRIGQTMFTCRFVLTPHGLRTAVWIRIPMGPYRFRRSLRRLLRKTVRRFRVESGPAVVDPVRERLYARYLTIARGDRPATLHAFLYESGPTTALFDTREFTIWSGDELVALSYFDLGRHSIQSLLGAYDPSWSRHSLGFVTMLLEMLYVSQSRRGWFYPGYVLPGDASMDYKLRPGGVEFWDRTTRRWRPWDEFEGDVASDRIEAGLLAVQDELNALGIDAPVRCYPFYEAAAHDARLAACLAHPLVIEVPRRRREPRRLMVSLDPDKDAYEMVRCVPAGPPVDWDGRFDRTVDVIHTPLVVVERLGWSSSPHRVAADVVRFTR